MLRKIPKHRRSHSRCYIPEEAYSEASIRQSGVSLLNVEIRYLLYRLLCKTEKSDK